MIHFTADTHLGCDNLIANTRPMFSSTAEHDEVVLDGINRTVRPEDSLFIIGDFCNHARRVAAYRQRLVPRHIFYVLGNHDNETAIRKVFGGHVWKEKMCKVGNGVFILCAHHPQCFWDRSHYGVYHAYGHLHCNAMREAMMDLGLPGRRSMDVGIDSAYKLLGAHRPFSHIEFLEILSGREGHDIIKPEDRWKKRDYNATGTDNDI